MSLDFVLSYGLRLAPVNAPANLKGFETPITGDDGFVLPATQHDVLLWIAGPANDVVFDVVIQLVTTIDSVATMADETVSWSYHRDLDLTGFIDGTENPSLSVAPELVLVPPGEPGAGGSFLVGARTPTPSL